MERVGTRVRVFWEGEGEWFEGVVVDYDKTKGFFVQYDDGEQQWEEGSRENAIRFLLPAAAQQTETGQEAAEDEEYVDDRDEYEQDDDQVNNNEAESPPRSQFSEVSQPQERLKPRKATSYASNTLFFRDEESLREMLQLLQQEKTSLTHEYNTAAAELTEKELRSKELKRELDELKAQVTLANVMGGSSRPSRGNPRSSVEWKERVMDQKLSNRQLTQQIAESKACFAVKKNDVAKLHKTRKQLEDALARVPRRDLYTLVDVQVELAQLMTQKRALETQKPSNTTDKTSLASAHAAQKKQLEDELSRLEGSVANVKDEIHTSKLRYERQQACIRPLQDRLTQLQQELKAHKDANVLLRGVFQRLHPTVRESDGSQQVPVQAALAALVELAPTAAEPNQQPVDFESIRQVLLPDESVTFEQFVECFRMLFQEQTQVRMHQ